MEGVSLVFWKTKNKNKQNKKKSKIVLQVMKTCFPSLQVLKFFFLVLMTTAENGNNDSNGFCLFVFVAARDRVSCSLGWLPSCVVNGDWPSLLLTPPPSPKCWNHKYKRRCYSAGPREAASEAAMSFAFGFLKPWTSDRKISSPFTKTCTQGLYLRFRLVGHLRCYRFLQGGPWNPSFKNSASGAGEMA